MTFQPPQKAAGHRGFARGLILGLSVSLVVQAGCAVQRARENTRMGRNLVPVVVAVVDIPEGTVLTWELINQRTLPEPFVTSSVVTPGWASSVIGQRVLVPLQAGDMLLWSTFGKRSRP